MAPGGVPPSFHERTTPLARRSLLTFSVDRILAPDFGPPAAGCRSVCPSYLAKEGLTDGQTSLEVRGQAGGQYRVSVCRTSDLRIHFRTHPEDHRVLYEYYRNLGERLACCPSLQSESGDDVKCVLDGKTFADAFRHPPADASLIQQCPNRSAPSGDLTLKTDFKCTSDDNLFLDPERLLYRISSEDQLSYVNSPLFMSPRDPFTNYPSSEDIPSSPYSRCSTTSPFCDRSSTSDECDRKSDVTTASLEDKDTFMKLKFKLRNYIDKPEDSNSENPPSPDGGKRVSSGHSTTKTAKEEDDHSECSSSEEGHKSGSGQDMDREESSCEDTSAIQTSSSDLNKQSSLPVWLFATRYSCRPSSGPRSRRQPRRQAVPDEKRSRTAFSGAQLERLRREFQEHRYLTERRRAALAVELQLSEAQVKIWFQNHRAKLKRASGRRNPLALQLMACGLYDHSVAKTD